MYRLHCFAQSGNCFKVAFLLRALGVPFTTVYVDYVGGETRNPAWRESTNAMGEIPVLEDGARTLSQSGVILTYLAAKHGRFAGASEADKLEVLRWLLYDNHKFTSYFGSFRFMKSFAPTPPEPAVMAWLKGRIDVCYGVVDKHLSSRSFLVGSAPTIADFSLSGYLFYPLEESGYDYRARFPGIAAWVERLKSVPGWADPYDVLPGARVAPKW
ncbi:MAG TPA: glutathione S-transferase [Gammaproteobacteria bacterium]|nr:glutathione S-transferase [Gammaproteobacteria bacterium]